MKKIIASILAVGISIGCIASAGAANINMCVKDNYVTRDLQTLGSIDMIPILDIAGELGLKTYFDGYTLWIEKDYKAYKFALNSANVYDEQGNWYGLDVTMRYINGKLYIPSSFLTNVLGISYSWDNITKTLYIDADRTLNWVKTTQEYEDAVNCRTAYAEYLKLNSYLWNYESKFSLEYIDNDDIPELLVSMDEEDDTPVNIFTYKNGSIVNLGDMGGGGQVACKEKSGQIYGAFYDYDYYEDIEYGFLVLCEIVDNSLEVVHNIGFNTYGSMLVDDEYVDASYGEYIYSNYFENFINNIEDYRIIPEYDITDWNIENYLLRY